MPSIYLISTLEIGKETLSQICIYMKIYPNASVMKFVRNVTQRKENFEGKTNCNGFVVLIIQKTRQIKINRSTQINNYSTSPFYSFERT